MYSGHPGLVSLQSETRMLANLGLWPIILRRSSETSSVILLAVRQYGKIRGQVVCLRLGRPDSRRGRHDATGGCQVMLEGFFSDKGNERAGGVLASS